MLSTFVLNRNLHVALFGETFKLLSPLDEQDSIGLHQVVQGQGVEFALRVNAVKVDVEQRDFRSAIFVDESKRGTGDGFSFRGFETFSNTFDHGGLPCSQVAAQQHDAARLELSGELAAEFGGFVGGMGVEGRHRSFVIFHSSSLEIRELAEGFFLAHRKSLADAMDDVRGKHGLFAMKVAGDVPGQPVEENGLAHGLAIQERD